MYPLTQDVRVDLVVPTGSGTVTPFCDYAGGAPAFGLAPYPADDDARFPYYPRRAHATGFQFDVYCLRRLPLDYANGVLDELGAPLLDEYGAPIA